MSNPKVSVVVPIYNVETYLRKCVNSILAQTLEDIEIILVDDGSPDCCGEIADEYAQKDDRVKVIHQENAGLGPARNTGIMNAEGEYIGFVDSDDWVDPQMFEELYNAATHCNADICFSGMKRITDGVESERNINPFAGQVLKGSKEIFRLRRSFYGPLPNRQKCDPLPISVWNAVYRRSMIEDNHLRFLNIRSEDKFFNTAACKAAVVVTAIGETRYNYRCDGQESITRSFSTNMVDSYLTLFRELFVMAQREDSQYRDECVVRAKRCVIDYTRVAIQVIVKSVDSENRKNSAIQRLIYDGTVNEALNKYKLRKLPFKQSVFGFAMRFKNIALLKIFAFFQSRF